MSYWIDTNVLVNCANRIYKFHRYPEFWNFLSVKFEEQIIRSSEFVYREMVKDRYDQLAIWCRTRKGTALNTPASNDVQNRSRELMNFVEHEPKYERQHKSEFYESADCWLIAHAIAEPGIVVTFETEREYGKIKVNSVCAKRKIKCIDVYQLQDLLDFKPSDYR